MELILTHSMVYAIGWTIIRSLWQITLIALVLRVIMLSLKNSKAEIRYIISVAALSLALICSVVTFGIEYSNVSETQLSYSNIGTNTDGLNISPGTDKYTEAAYVSDISSNLKAFFDKNLNLIVIAWNICVFVLFIKLLGGLLYSRRIKFEGTSSLPERVNKQLLHLAEITGIKKSVRILESAIVKIPVVIGYFKPVILLPVGVMTGLTDDQIEAIIAHELAHIKRNDFLINIFQRLTEILFFYHPAVWYISTSIRNEREGACDDMAAANCTSRVSLAKALANIEIINHKKIGLTMAFTRHKKTLLYRLKRILGSEKQGFTFREGLITVIIIIAGLIIMSFSAKLIAENGKTQDAKEQSNKYVSSSKIFETKTPATFKINKAGIINNPNILKELKKTNAQEDTIIKKVQENLIIYSVKGKTYHLEFDKNEKVTLFKVDNKIIPEKDYKKYEKEIKLGFNLKKRHEKQMAEFEIQMEQHKKELAKYEKEMAEYELQLQKKLQMHEKEIAEYEKQMKKHDIEMKDKDKIMEEYEIQMQKHAKDMKDKEKAMIEYEIQMQKHAKDMKGHEKEMIEYEIQMKKHEKEMKDKDKLLKEYQIQMEMHEKEMQKQLKIHEKQMAEYEMQMEQHEQEMKKHEAEMKLFEEKFAIIEDMLDEMKKDKLLDKNAESFQLKFTEKEIFINGKKQSDKVFKKYKKYFDSKSEGKFEFKGEYNFNTH